MPTHRDDEQDREFVFRFEPRYRTAAAPFGVRAGTALIVVGNGELRVRFGPWRVRTPLSNISAVSRSGPFRFWRTGGPARLGLSDRGLTFATNSTTGVLIEFLYPLTGIDPTGLIRHSNLTLTPALPEPLIARLRP